MSSESEDNNSDSKDDDESKDKDDDDCHDSYPDLCIPPPLPDLNCDDISDENILVKGSDLHRFDNDNDGSGCDG
jgi:hypothetical protein